MSEDHRVCPPCCPPLHFLILFSGSIQISPRLSSSLFSSLLLFLTTPSLPYYVSFHLQSTHLYSFFCFYSCLFLALHLFSSLRSCLEIVFLLRENQSVHMHVYTDLPPPTHTHTDTHAHTLLHTHVKRTAIQKICSRTVYDAPGYICARSFAGCQDGLISVGACRQKSSLRCYKYYHRERKK